MVRQMSTDFPTLLLALRNAAARHCTADITPIAEHIQVMALAVSSEEHPCSFKDFAAVLPYSDERISQLIHKMVDEGWLEFRRCPTDGRVKHVVPSPTLRNLYAALEKEVGGALLDYALTMPSATRPQEHGPAPAGSPSNSATLADAGAADAPSSPAHATRASG